MYVSSLTHTPTNPLIMIPEAQRSGTHTPLQKGAGASKHGSNPYHAGGSSSPPAPAAEQAALRRVARPNQQPAQRAAGEQAAPQSQHAQRPQRAGWRLSARG